MGCSSSKIEKSEALRLCKERKRLIKQAIESRYALSAAHLSYVQSIRSIGIALRRFAEAEVLIESSLSTSATELEKTPSHSSYPSPSPVTNAETLDSPLNNERSHSSPLSDISYMKSGGSATVTVRLNPTMHSFVEDDSLTFPPPPPPPPEMGFSWDFFDPTGETESSRFIRENGLDRNSDSLGELRQFRGEEIVTFSGEEGEKVGTQGNGELFGGSIKSEFEKRGHGISLNSTARSQDFNILETSNAHSFNGNASKRTQDAEQRKVFNDKVLEPNLVISGSAETLAGNAALKQSNLKREKTGPEKDLCTEREEPSELIIHEAKDFLSSIKDIECHFLRASESGKEVSSMLEANRIPLRCPEAKGRSSNSLFLAAFHLGCCRGETVLPNEPPQNITKVITWKRSTSSQSSSSKNPLASVSKDDIDDNGSDFIEEFCMITGSHASTLDRLYAWERKLYDEVKASESIRKEYDQRCDQLRHQFARDAGAHEIDKTRAIVKDLHSQVRVAIHAVDLIAKRIEKMRDEELQPQLVELLQGLIRMWKVMLECHRTQYITISSAYHAKSSTAGPIQGDSHGQVVAHLQHEIECFGSSFANWIDAHRLYVEALNGWLENCIILPQERSRGRRAFSPRRALAPPIFVLFRDWAAGIKSLPSGEFIDAIKALVSELNSSVAQQVEEQKKQVLSDLDDNGETKSRGEGENSSVSSNLSGVHSSLAKVLDWLTKFAEALLKVYEGTEAAQIAYANCRTTRL